MTRDQVIEQHNHLMVIGEQLEQLDQVFDSKTRTNLIPTDALIHAISALIKIHKVHTRLIIALLQEKLSDK